MLTSADVQRLKNLRKQFKTTNVVEIDAEIAQACLKLVKHKHFFLAASASTSLSISFAVKLVK